MKRALTFVFVLGFTCCLYSQAVDTTVCDILNNPQSFNGKIVRIKGTAVASFDQFVVKGADCGINTNKNIWLSYPEGTKGKAGPAAMVQVQPAHNFTGDVPAVQRTPVTLDKSNKDFKLFDSQLAAQYHKGGMCLGCNKFEVTATLVGRIDAVEKAGVQRDKAGKIIGFGGFGHLNAYATRLVLQSVSDITSKEIDYSATLALTKDDTAPEKLAADPLVAARSLADAYAAGDKTGEMFKRAAYAYGKSNEKNTGVVIVHTAGNEAAAKYEGKAAIDSPDGLLFTCIINESKLFGDAENRAIMFDGENVADLRNPSPDDMNVPFFDQELHALAILALDAFANGQKTLTLPGGYLIWNKAWPTDGVSKNVDDAIESFVLKDELLHE